MDELAPGVYAIELTVEADGTERRFHPAAVETDGGLVLVDTGLPGMLDELEAELAEAGFDLADVEFVVLTHHDGDHAGMLAEFLDRVDVPVLASHEETPYVVGEEEPIKSQGDRYPPARVDVEFGDGTVFRTAAGPMEVVATPGHTPGHVSLYLPDEKLLIAADAMVAEEDLSGPNEAYTPNMERAAESVGRLADLDVEGTLCYHGGFVEHDADRIGEIHDSLA